jgi:hypothetical protein
MLGSAFLIRRDDAMAPHWQLFLSLAPLSLYLLLVGSWHARRSPRVVLGPLDLLLLVGGIGGLALFGPFGHFATKVLFGKPSVIHALTLASGFLLVALLMSRNAWRTLAVYHVDRPALDRAIRAALQELPGSRFVETLRGYEDEANQQGLSVETSARWCTATVEAFGRDPEILIHRLGTLLKRRFRAVEGPRTTRPAWIFLAAAALTLLTPCASWLISQPEARAALRSFFERIPGG